MGRNLARGASWLLLALVVRAAVSVCAIHSGFRALSDDDFSRVVIAQSFAAHPSLDPSGTSWLPFPFWLYGTCLAVFGATLAKARAVAFALGLLGAAGLWLAGRWLGLSRRTSVLAVVIGSCIPYSAWLGVATTPDFLSAILVLLAGCSLARGRRSIRIWGAIALFAAALSRYEAWPVVLIWAAWVAIDGVRSKRRSGWLLATLVLVAPLAWMLHGALHHHDALFFVKRVVSYRRALGLTGDSVFSRLVSAPRHLFVDAPELFLLGGVLTIACRWLNVPLLRRRWFAPFLCMLGILVFLMIGDWREGTATHHIGRTLLPVWLFLSLVLAKAIATCARKTHLTSRALGAVAIAASYALAWGWLRPALTNLDGFSPRIDETDVGLLASAHVSKGQRLAIYSDDYGYFAVQAAFARPAAILDAHDPRHPSAVSVVSSAASLSNGLNQHRAEWLVLPRKYESLLSPETRVRFGNSAFLLAESGH